MIVCGIDPGLDTTGYAVLRCADRDGAVILDAGVLRTTLAAELADRLVQLGDDFADVLGQWQPTTVGVEQLYAHYKHPRTAIQMGHARGVLMATAARAGARIVSFSATHVKKHLTGNGRASKTQVQQAVQAFFGLSGPPEPADVADAIAIAFCCGHEAYVGDTSPLHVPF
jgi:crossover junction endodeoxyribonuclease RuvC